MSGEVIIMPPSADLFASGAEVLVNPVDAATGAHGKGLAKLFALRFPSLAQEYRRVAKMGAMRAGNVWVGNLPLRWASDQKWIFFAATKEHWRHDSTLAIIENTAANVRREAFALAVRSVAIPALGCGLGGLAWDDVRPLLESEGEVMAAAGVRVFIYPPHEGEKRERR